MFGSNDIEQVLAHRDGKHEAAHSVTNRDFVQIEIEGANHFFDDHNEQLISNVSSWLDELHQ